MNYVYYISESVPIQYYFTKKSSSSSTNRNSIKYRPFLDSMSITKFQMWYLIVWDENGICEKIKKHLSFRITYNV